MESLFLNKFFFRQLSNDLGIYRDFSQRGAVVIKIGNRSTVKNRCGGIFPAGLPVPGPGVVPIVVSSGRALTGVCQAGMRADKAGNFPGNGFAFCIFKKSVQHLG